MKPKFTILDPKGGIAVSGDGMALTQSVYGHHFAPLTPQIPAHSPPSYVKFKINKQVTAGLWVFLGVIGKENPTSSSFSDRTCYGWAGHTGSKWVHIAGTNTPGHDGFTDFQQGDVVVLKLDTSSDTLKMHNSGLARVFTISGLADIPYWFHVNLAFSGDLVEVLDMTPSDMKLF